MNKIQLKILGISAGNVASSYTLLLEEVNGERKLPVVIGVLEAQAIAIEIEKIEPLRPMTHDLFKSLANSFGLKLKEVLIHKLHEGIFYANLIVTNGENEKSIDSRTSDAIALALRFNTPIFIYEEIMDEAGIELKSMHIKDLKEDPEQQEGLNLKILQKNLRIVQNQKNLKISKVWAYEN
jgi:bifunctional DNase/RNase